MGRVRQSEKCARKGKNKKSRFKQKNECLHGINDKYDINQKLF